MPQFDLNLSSSQLNEDSIRTLFSIITIILNEKLPDQMKEDFKKTETFVLNISNNELLKDTFCCILQENLAFISNFNSVHLNLSKTGFTNQGL